MEMGGIEGMVEMGGLAEVGLLWERVLRFSVLILVPLGSNFWIKPETLEPNGPATIPSNRSSTSTSTKPKTRRTVVLILARWFSVRFRSDKSRRAGFGGGGALRVLGGEVNGFDVT